MQDTGKTKYRKNPFLKSIGIMAATMAFMHLGTREGYLDGDKMLEQVLEFIDAFNFLHPDNQALFIFDWSSGHSK